jgi:hypothetical protein
MTIVKTRTLDLKGLIALGVDLVERSVSPERAALYIDYSIISGDTIAELARLYAMEAKGVRPLAVDELHLAGAQITPEDEDPLVVCRCEATYTPVEVEGLGDSPLCLLCERELFPS